MRRWLAALSIAILAAFLAVSPVRSGVGNCRPAWKCGAPSASVPASVPPAPSASPAATASALPTASAAPTNSATPSPSASSYSFDDEFDALSSRWATNYHVPASVVVAYDKPTVSGGYLHLPLTKQADGWHGSSIDTKLSFTQRYGTFTARIWFPEGKGLWPAFWGYTGGPEIDGMEVCANPLGTNGGNDASLLHQTIHFSSSSSTGYPTRHADLGGGWHVYGWTWTASGIAFSLDGATTATWSGSFTTAMPVILDLVVGGSWCSNPDSTTPTSSEMLVDWVHVSP